MRFPNREIGLGTINSEQHFKITQNNKKPSHCKVKAMHRQEKSLSESDKETLRKNWIKLRAEYFGYIPIQKTDEDYSPDASSLKLESGSKPNLGLILAIKDLMAYGIKSQREVALEVGVR